MTLFQIIQKHGLDQIGGGPSSSDYLEFRKTVVTSILATDMALHGDYVEKIHAQAQRISQGNFQSLDDASCQNERLILCSALIKCADISNVTRPFLRAARWAELLVQECVSQGDLERAMGLPSLPMNDRDKIVLEDSQIGFIRFVALGLFESVCKVLPEMSFTVEYIHSNLKRWEKRKSASHDSGVGSLTDNDPLEQVGCKRRSNSLDCHTNAVEVLRKRLSLDTGYHRHHAAAAMAAAARRRSAGSIPECEAVFHKLPTMPAYARIDHVENENTPAMDHHHHHHHHHHEYEGGPVFCQCTIQ
ncbi:hypothetical protein LRAMOSA05933 [Lichtheimia ramosa]|uniref:PDEase domain-containing protein n=1 Tax=Lichtheimia ramosa TaxID=688394 RepID=A0A077X2P2_9FUNG|nr:hypothetical protein LRAMOSA05933 [Lichtheimia ramosa]